MRKSFRRLAAENVEKFPWVSRGKCGKVSVGGCQAATCGHSSGCKWPRKMRKSFRGRKSGGHLRPLAATRVAARLQVAAGDKRMLAATCGHSSGCKWLQVAAGDKKMLPLAATCGHSSGCKRLQVAAGDKRMLAATCGHLRPLVRYAGGHLRPRHLRPLAATRVAASGCKWLP